MKNIILDLYLESTQNNDQLNEQVFATTAAVISSTFMAASILKMASGALSNILTKAGQECGTLQGAARNLCMIKMKLDGHEEELRILKSKSRLCNKTRNPNKCREKLRGRIIELSKKLKRLKEQESIYLQKQNAERRTEVQGTRV